jgi:subtilisin-like proprotein convertase family protein
MEIVSFAGGVQTRGNHHPNSSSIEGKAGEAQEVTMKVRLFVYVSLFLLMGAVSAGATGTCWISEYPGGPSLNFVSDNDGVNQKTYWLNYNGVTNGLKFKVKLNSASPQTTQVQKLKGINGLVSAPISFPADGGNLIHGPAKLVAKDDNSKCTWDFTVGKILRLNFGGPFVINDFFTVCPNLNVTGIHTVGHVRIAFYVQHTFDGDLQLTATAPNNVMVPLSTNNGGAGDNYGQGFSEQFGFPQLTVFDDNGPTLITAATPPYVGIFMPQSPLSVFNGLTGNQANGIWQLCVADGTAGDTGYLLGGYMEITDQD